MTTSSNAVPVDPKLAPFHDLVRNQFTGAARTNIRCLECGHVARSDSPFLGMLSLSLPDQEQTSWVPPSKIEAMATAAAAAAGGGGDSAMSDGPSQAAAAAAAAAAIAAASAAPPPPPPPKDGLPPDPPGSGRRGRRARAAEGSVPTIALTDVFSFNFDRYERLEGANAYRCDKCKKPSTAELVSLTLLNRLFTLSFLVAPRLVCPLSHRSSRFPLLLATLPSQRQRLGALPSRYLICHLVRTAFDFKTLTTCKNQTGVTFPLNNLDLTPYLDVAVDGGDAVAAAAAEEEAGRRKSGARGSGAGAAAAAAGKGKKDAKGAPASGRGGRRATADADNEGSENEGSEKYEYDLFAVVTHHGRGMQEGHFTAYARNPLTQSWLLFNDASVRPVDDATVSASQPYMLFYQRKGKE